MNNRILGIIGAALLILGLFLPIVSFMGFGVSYFDGIRASPAQAWSGVLLLLLGIASLYCALTYKYKILIATGVVSLCLLALDFFRLRSALSNSTEAADSADQLAAMVSIGWGFYVMVIGAILLVVAGVMKNTVPVMNPGYGAPPPPPYTPR
jgi:ABC-type multidrug transport system permease subunit